MADCVVEISSFHVLGLQHCNCQFCCRRAENLVGLAADGEDDLSEHPLGCFRDGQSSWRLWVNLPNHPLCQVRIRDHNPHRLLGFRKQEIVVTVCDMHCQILTKLRTADAEEQLDYG